MVATSTSIPTCRTDGLGVKGGCLSESILVVETKCPPGALSISLSSPGAAGSTRRRRLSSTDDDVGVVVVVIGMPANKSGIAN